MTQYLKGLDASSVQGSIPFARLVEADIRFVILKAQQGNDGFDPWFERNMNAALEHGIEPFAYCFFYPLPTRDKKTGREISTRDPRHQAKLFVDRIHRFEPMRGRPIFIDEEWPETENWEEWGCTAKSINEAMRINAAEVHELSGRSPVLYTYLWWWNSVTKGADTAWARDYELWMAWYTNKWPGPDSKPKVPLPWTHARFWQFDGNGGLLLPNGVDADFCVFDGSESDLKRFAGIPDATPTIPSVVPEVRTDPLGHVAIVHPDVPLGRPALDGELPTTEPDDDESPE